MGRRLPPTHMYDGVATSDSLHQQSYILGGWMELEAVYAASHGASGRHTRTSTQAQIIHNTLALAIMFGVRCLVQRSCVVCGLQFL